MGRRYTYLASTQTARSTSFRNVIGIQFRTRLAACSISALLVVGCSAQIPNLPPDAYTVYFKNDLAYPIRVSLCSDNPAAGCSSPYYRDVARPGQTITENIGPDARSVWAIEGPAGQLLRCVNLEFGDIEPSMQARTVVVSDAPRWRLPCPNGPYHSAPA